jgi:predicted MFS family arabinose efflux permease
LPNIVQPEELGPASVLMGSTWGTMLAAGAAIGGLVTTKFGRDVSFLVDAASFLVSALVLWRMRVPFSEAREEHHEQPPLLESIRETIHYALAHPRVLALLTTKGGYGIAAGVIAMLSVFGKQVFQAGALGIGLLFAARGLGALLGPFLLRAIAREDAQYRAIVYCVLAFGAGYSALALSPSLTFGLIAIFFAHLGGGAAWQISTYGLQRETPDYIRGRVFAADYGFVTLTMSVSSLFTGIAADQLGPVHATIGTASAALLFAIIWGASTWRLWR